MTCIILDPFPPDDDGDLNKDVGALARQMGAILDILRRLTLTGEATDFDREQLLLLRKSNSVICDRYARSAPLAGDTPAAVAAPGSFAADRRRRSTRGSRPYIRRVTRPKTT